MREEINKAVEVLRSGNIILYPTDTIWGLGCDATNEDAVQRIYSIKKRIDSKSMLILLHSVDSLYDYVKEIPEMAFDLIEFTTKPLTLIYPGAQNIAKNLISEDGSVGIRITDDELCNSLIKKLGKPIVSTSANISGQLSPGNFREISKEIKNAVDYVMNIKQDEGKKSKPSSVIKIDMNNIVKIIRE